MIVLMKSEFAAGSALFHAIAANLFNDSKGWPQWSYDV
jgi:hypothetical protein